MKTEFKLPEGFLMGTATAGAQIEGGDVNSDWYRWCCEPGRIKDGTSCYRANNHYELFREDLALMRDMGMQIYRFGIEWSRIQPKEGVFDSAAMEHYIQETQLMLSYGIKPLVTLFHFSQPIWFADKGGFTKAENVPLFLQYAKYVVKSLGGLANEYITINEPNVFAYFGYAYGGWPPGKKSVGLAFKVISNLAAAHILAYGKIHELRGAAGFTDTKVSYAHHAAVFEPKHAKNPYSRLQTRVMERCFQAAPARAFFTGEFVSPLRKPKLLKGAPAQKTYCDYIALNYYTRQTVSALRAGARDGAVKNDLGWEIYPEGLGILIKELYERYKLPVFITENGVCDAKDVHRCEYIYTHLKAALESGAPVQRYYYWTFMDNFEWADGESARFGLIECDYETQARRVRRSGRFYSDIIKNGGVTEKMLKEYNI